MFGLTASESFSPSTVWLRALAAWSSANEQKGGGADLQPITLHEARDTFASLMMTAGVNAEVLHTSWALITVTFDLYGRPVPGNEEEAADMLHSYLPGRREGGVPSAAARTRPGRPSPQ